MTAPILQSQPHPQQPLQHHKPTCTKYIGIGMYYHYRCLAEPPEGPRSDNKKNNITVSVAQLFPHCITIAIASQSPRRARGAITKKNAITVVSSIIIIAVLPSIRDLCIGAQCDMMRYRCMWNYIGVHGL